MLGVWDELQELNDYAEAWLAAMRHLKNYDKRAALGDWDAAAEAARQIRALTIELETVAATRGLPTRWETD